MEADKNIRKQGANAALPVSFSSLHFRERGRSCLVNNYNVTLVGSFSTPRCIFTPGQVVQLSGKSRNAFPLLSQLYFPYKRS